MKFFVAKIFPKSLKVRIAPLFLLLTFLLLVCLAFLLGLTSHAAQNPNKLGGMLEPVSFLPEGVRIRSGQNDLSIEYSAPAKATSSPLEFYIVLPFSAPLTPRIIDYALTAADGNTTRSISRADEASIKNLASAIQTANIISAKDEGTIRFCRLVKVTIPLKNLSFTSHSISRLTRLSVRFSFPKPIPPPSPLPEMASADRGFPQIFHHLIANPEAVSLYADRLSPEGNTPLGLHKPWIPQQQIPGHWFKILINKPGLYKILPGKIQSTNPQSVTRIFSRGKEIPALRIPSSDASSTDSTVVFYATASDSKYSTDRAYWICIPNSTGSAMAAASMPSAPAPSSAPASIPVIATDYDYVFEKDLSLLVQKGNFLSIKSSRWVWSELECQTPNNTRFNLLYLDKDSSAPATLSIQFHVGPSGSAPAAPDILASINGHSIGRIPLGPIAKPAGSDIKTSFSVPLEILQETGNALSFQFAQPLPKNGPPSGIFLDNLRLRTSRYLVATKEQLEFKTRTPATWYKMAGFREKTPFLFDISNPEQPALLQTQPALENTQTFYAPAANHTLLASSLEAIPEAPQLHLLGSSDLSDQSDKSEKSDQPNPKSKSPKTSDLKPQTSSLPGADYLIIYNHLFQNQIQPLIQLRKKQGLEVRAVDVDEIYQAYSYGEMSPQAIKTFLTDALRHWKNPPSYICLFGDANSDYRNELHTDVQNLVPAYSIDTDPIEVYASELWYATLLGKDMLPDILLGRISVQNAQDAEEVVRKIVDYSNNAPIGPWRARMGYCADFGPFGPAVERLHRDYKPEAYGSEQIFVDDMSWEDEFYLSRQVVKENNIKVSTPTTLRLLDTLDRGTALFIFFGHGSPNIWTDERIWFGGDDERSDNLNLRNENRLPFVSTYTCNQGAFDYPLPPWDINISEDMMRVKGRGSIAMYVPSGPGETPSHEQMARGLMKSIFREKLRRLGEITTLSRIYYKLGGGPDNLLRMYLLLGDPALDLAIPKEMNEGRVVPDSVNRLNFAARSSCVFTGSPKDMFHGSYVAALYDPEDNFVQRSEKKSFYFGKIRWKFDLPKNAKSGRWTVRVYYGNDRSREDGILYGTLNVTRPVMKVDSLRWNKIPSRSGELATGQFSLVNDSGMLTRDVPVEVTHRFPDGKEEMVISAVETIPPHQSRQITFPWKTQPGLHIFTARAKRYQYPADDSQPAQAEQFLAAYIPNFVSPASSQHLQSPPTLIPVPALVHSKWRSLAPETNFDLSIPLFYTNISSPLAAIANLVQNNGITLSTTTLTLQAAPTGEARETSITLAVRNQPKLPTSPLYLAIRPAAVSETSNYKLQTSNPPPLSTIHYPLPTFLKAPIDLGNPQLPDLEIVPGSAEFKPRNPVEGETIFARVLVRNKGHVPSAPFRIQVSAIHPDQSEEALRSRGDDPELFEPLAPGRARYAHTRWDYDAYRDYAGSNPVRIKVVPQVETTIQKELRTDNDAMVVSLRVLKRPFVDVDVLSKSMRPITAPKTASDAGKASASAREFSIRVRVKNTGEAPASGYLLGFYNKTPIKHDDYLTTGFLHYQQALPPLQGHEQKIFSYKWTIPSADRDTSPTAKVYRITRSIRGRDISLRRFAREW